MEIRVRLDVSEKGKVFCPTRNRNAISRFSSPESSLHTCYAISAPIVSIFYISLARGGRYQSHVAQRVQ